MGRSRFITPNIVRLRFADVHRRLHQRCQEQLAEAQRNSQEESVIKRLRDELANEAALLARAEEDGDWIDVKAELNTGEERRVFTNLVKSMRHGEPTELDPALVGKTQLLEYIIGWSFVGPDGEPVPCNAATLDNLDRDTYVEDVLAAVQLHIEDVEKARDMRKNGRSTSMASSAISA